MKVVLVNGSPNANGCTFTGLSIIKEQLAKNGVDSEIFQVGKKPVLGCTACRVCKQQGKAGGKKTEVRRMYCQLQKRRFQRNF